jgi:predicted dehydrogenase
VDRHTRPCAMGDCFATATASILRRTGAEYSDSRGAGLRAFGQQLQLNLLNGRAKVKTYRVAIVGLGRMGSTIDDEGHTTLPYSVASATTASSRLELVAGCDLVAEKRERFTDRWGVQAVYEDMRKMVEAERPDLVAVCTRAAGTDQREAPSANYRVDLHADLTVELANMGVSMLYVEKAMACSMRRADEIRAAIQKNNCALNTGVLRRFDNRYEPVRDVVLGGRLGEVKAAIHYAASSLLHGHIHSMDTLSWLLGDPAIDRVRGQFDDADYVIEDNHVASDPRATYQLRFAGGVDAWSLPAAHWEFEILGTDGGVRSFNNGTSSQLRLATEGGGWEEVPLAPVTPTSTVVSCLEDLVNSLEAGQMTRGHVEITHQITQACLGVAESHRQGGRWLKPAEVDPDLYVFHI